MGKSRVSLEVSRRVGPSSVPGLISLRALAWAHASIAGALLPAQALAQSDTNVATVAVDAFGESVGSEQIGLYNERQVRGFSLQESGNYRLDGAYFIRSANVIPLVRDGTTIRVGINALDFDFPAPSGIVEYRLAAAPPGTEHELELRSGEYGGGILLARGSTANSDGTFGVAYGTQIMESREAQGQWRHPRHYGIVPTWQPNDRLRIRAMFSADRFFKSGGDFGVVATDTELPPVQPVPNKYYTDWGRIEQWQLAGGIVARYAATDNLTLQTSFAATDYDKWRTDFTRLAIGEDGTGTATAVRGGPFEARSLSAEGKFNWRVDPDHRIFGTMRWRKSTTSVRGSVAADPIFFDQELGLADIARPTDPVQPSTDDETRQATVGLGYETNLSDALRVRGAVLRSQYERDVFPPGLPVQSNETSPWLYDVAVRLVPTDRLTLYATTIRGLEESGVAPNNADNRNEVLPAVLTDQYELGLRYQLFESMTFITSLFEVSKPTPGIDSQNIYRLVGTARHRGIEFSLVGRPIPSLNVLSGLVILDPAREGELIDEGVLIGTAPGVARVTGLLNLNYDLPSVEGLSIDGQVTYNSRMLVNPRTGLYTPASAIFDLGARYRFSLVGHEATLRARIVNVLNEDQWNANRNETISRTDPRAATVSLTWHFDEL